MSRTSSEVKRRYNSKTYRRWSADLRLEDFNRLEELRGDLSRAAFLKELLRYYETGREPGVQTERSGE